MTTPLTGPRTLPTFDFQTVIDRLGQAVVLFDSSGRWICDNPAAREVLGVNLLSIRTDGWRAAVMLLDSRRIRMPSAEEVYQKAQTAASAIRFSALINGVYTPCWGSCLPFDGKPSDVGKQYFMLTIDRPDWSALAELMDVFHQEATEAISATRGHAELMLQLMRKMPANMTTDKLAVRIKGFAALIVTHMHHVAMLNTHLTRLEAIRTQRLEKELRESTRRIKLDEFIEDYVEQIEELSLFEPGRGDGLRARLKYKVAPGVSVQASPAHLTRIMGDLIRNAVMYSPLDSPIEIDGVKSMGVNSAQLNITDQGVGIPAREAERVFAQFQRGRQPQVIAEFGFGVSLYLSKVEIEAMGGRIWYESDPATGTTFSLKLPLWKANS